MSRRLPSPKHHGTTAGHAAERLASDLQDAFFDYGRSAIRVDARDVLGRDATVLKAILNDFPNSSIVVEGHCDDRGSAEYNLGLGDERASFAVDFLVRSGVPAQRLRTISYGKERPQCIESGEPCWQRNRRVHFSTASNVTRVSPKSPTGRVAGQPAHKNRTWFHQIRTPSPLPAILSCHLFADDRGAIDSDFDAYGVPIRLRYGLWR